MPRATASSGSSCSNLSDSDLPFDLYNVYVEDFDSGGGAGGESTNPTQPDYVVQRSSSFTHERYLLVLKTNFAEAFSVHLRKIRFRHNGPKAGHFQVEFFWAA